MTTKKFTEDIMDNVVEKQEEYQIGIYVNDIEKKDIIDNSPKTLPLNPTQQGYTGQEIRRLMYHAICGDTKSMLALAHYKNNEILDFINDELARDIKLNDNIDFLRETRKLLNIYYNKSELDQENIENFKDKDLVIVVGDELYNHHTMIYEFDEPTLSWVVYGQFLFDAYGKAYIDDLEKRIVANEKEIVKNQKEINDIKLELQQIAGEDTSITDRLNSLETSQIVQDNNIISLQNKTNTNATTIGNLQDKDVELINKIMENDNAIELINRILLSKLDTDILSYDAVTSIKDSDYLLIHDGTKFVRMQKILLGVDSDNGESNSADKHNRGTFETLAIANATITDKVVNDYVYINTNTDSPMLAIFDVDTNLFAISGNDYFLDRKTYNAFITAYNADMNTLRNYLNALDSEVNAKVDKVVGKDLVENTKVTLYDNHIANEDIHITEDERTSWNGKVNSADLTNLDLINETALNNANLFNPFAFYEIGDYNSINEDGSLVLYSSAPNGTVRIVFVDEKLVQVGNSSDIGKTSITIPENAYAAYLYASGQNSKYAKYKLSDINCAAGDFVYISANVREVNDNNIVVDKIMISKYDLPYYTFIEEIINNLTSTSITQAASANMVRLLNEIKINKSDIVTSLTDNSTTKPASAYLTALLQLNKVGYGDLTNLDLINDVALKNANLVDLPGYTYTTSPIKEYNVTDFPTLLDLPRGVPLYCTYDMDLETEGVYPYGSICFRIDGTNNFYDVSNNKSFTLPTTGNIEVFIIYSNLDTAPGTSSNIMISKYPNIEYRPYVNEQIESDKAITYEINKQFYSGAGFTENQGPTIATGLTLDFEKYYYEVDFFVYETGWSSVFCTLTFSQNNQRVNKVMNFGVTTATYTTGRSFTFSIVLTNNGDLKLFFLSTNYPKAIDIIKIRAVPYRKGN